MSTLEPQFIDKDARDERNPGTSILTQAPITPRPQLANHSSGDEGRPSVPVSPRGPPTTLEPQTLEDRDAPNRARAVQRGETPSMPGASNASPTAISIAGANVRFESTHFTGGGHAFGNNSVVNNFMSDDINGLRKSIANLPRVQASQKDYQTSKKSGPCFPGTRETLLREMMDWVNGPGKSRMYVLSGLAGIGKSTVVYTVATQAEELGLLGASFFFSRDEDARSNARRFFNTIAYQLCVYDETFSKAIGDVLITERGSAAATHNPQEQLKVLILDPLRSVVQSRSRPILIVVDALDECDEEDASLVLAGLSQLVQDLPSFKVILTTRPFDPVLGNQGDRQIFHLQDIEDKIVDSDIRLYLQHNLSLEQMQRRYPRRQWCASDEQIDCLVHAVGRLFIIASTTVRYIFDKTASNPAAQMEKLLLASAHDHTPFKDLDGFYAIILRNVIPENCDDDTVSRYQSVVGAIIFVQRPLPVSTLGHLINRDVDDIHAVLDHLQSVISLGGDNVARIYHKSFPDYLTDKTRCKDPRLRIDTRTPHTRIAIQCFEIMEKHLKRNILGLGNPARFMSNEDGFKEDGITEEQLQEKIPEQLRYACAYCINHIEVANIEDETLTNRLERFAHEHILFWLETLSLIGKLDLAHNAISVVLKLLKSTSSDLHRLLSDALRFISKFYDIIKRSALHTYHSALPFTPSDSLVYRRYIKEAEDNICSIEGGPEKWDPLVANLSHESVRVVKFSLDSAFFISSSEEDEDTQGKLKIWDAVTGTPIYTIPGDRFAVANDFSTVASSEDKVITFYNMNGSTRGTMFTTLPKIKELALSSESSRVAAALSDGTVWLWDSGNAELIDKFDGFKDSEYVHDKPCLQFSLTGTRLAYSSANGIKLRDGISGRSIADLQCESSDDRNFEFSDDGSRIAFLSSNSLKLWDSESGRLVGDVSCVDQRVLAISTDGSLLASANHNITVTLRNNRLARIMRLVVGYVHSMAFSSDNILAIATNNELQLYNVKTFALIHTLPRIGSPIAFSPDCTRLACGYDDSVNLLDIFDIRGIDASYPRMPISFRNFATAVTALALSRDCSRLACGFKDGRVELWGTSPTMRRIDPRALYSKVKATFFRIFSLSHHTKSVLALGFVPDGRLFASGSADDTIKLWDGGDGALRGTLEAPGKLSAVGLSNTLLVAAARKGGVTLWELDTLGRIHTFDKEAFKVSIAENSALVAIAGVSVTGDGHRVISLFDTVNRTEIATFDVPSDIHTMTFLPDNSHLVVQSDNGTLLSPNLINKRVINGPALGHLIQLPNTPLWHGVPIWHCQDKEQHYFAALFSQDKSPVPMLWIPRYLRVEAWTQGSCMIALGCHNGRVILLRLPPRHVS